MAGALALATAAFLTACGSAENDPGPGGVTVGEAQALDEAAEMIEQQRLPEGALPPEDKATVVEADEAEATAQPE